MPLPQAILNLSYSFELPGYEPIPALKNVSITDIRPGQMIFIIGPNGSGKSTLLNCIAGRLPRTRPIQCRFSYIPQQPLEGVVLDLTVIENIILRRIIDIGTNLRKAITPSIRTEVSNICKELRLDDILERLDHPPSTLSGGQVQLLNILSAMTSQPELILLDEPTSKLDEVNKIKVLNVLIEASRRTKAPIICATHDLHYVDRIADRIITLRDGEIVRDQIVREPGSKRFVGEIRLATRKDQLPPEFTDHNQNWWEPKKGGLFPDDYFEGDDSTIGYLAHRAMSRDERTTREINGVINLLSLSDDGGQRILDIPCGWGRHAIELAKKGFNVTGIDLCESYISAANRKAAELQLRNVKFAVGDMRSIPCDSGSFDYVINLWTSFGFFLDDDDNLKALSEFARVLKPNGRLLLHSDHNAFRVTHGIFDEPKERKLNSGGTLEVTEFFCSEDHAIYGIWKVSKPVSPHRVDRKHTYRIKIYSELDWRSMASKTGLQLETIWGSFDRFNLNLTQLSQEQIVILKK